MNIKVDKDSLEHFLFMLEVGTDHKSLIKYFKENILEEERQDMNDLKKSVYALMKSSTGNKSRAYYFLYQEIKEGLITCAEARDKLNYIG
jgi:hypothetical protein